MVLREPRGQGHLVDAETLMGLSEEQREDAASTDDATSDKEGKKHPGFSVSPFFKYLPLSKHS